MTTPRTPEHGERLHALADGRLGAHEAREFLATLDAAERDQVQHWRTQRERLRALHPEVLTEPIPPDMASSALRLQTHLGQDRTFARWGGIAAGLILAFTAGWFAQREARTPAVPVLAQKTTPDQRFAYAATVAHALYQPEVRHPVEVGAADEKHLLQWLSNRLGRQLQAPDLTSAGYQLVGGRLLPGDGTNARAQFMYQDTRNGRITLYLGALPEPLAKDSAGETGFRFEQNGRTHAFYWVSHDFGYALAGNLPRAQLLRLATLVHQQLH